MAAPTPAPDTRRSDLADLAEMLANARVTLDEANDVAKEKQAVYDTIEADLFDQLENAGIQQIRTERGLFRLNDLAWATVTDEAAAREWAEQNEPALLLLNRQRLSTVVRQIIKGEAVPGLEPGQFPPGVDFKTSRKITWRRS
jgi:hypothetical protein